MPRPKKSSQRAKLQNKVGKTGFAASGAVDAYLEVEEVKKKIVQELLDQIERESASASNNDGKEKK